jgi:hypothetical protein
MTERLDGWPKKSAARAVVHRVDGPRGAKVIVLATKEQVVAEIEAGAATLGEAQDRAVAKNRVETP